MSGSAPRLLAPVALVAAVIAGVSVLGSCAATRYHATAVFQQSYGLIPGSRVLAGGVKVGEVSSTGLGTDGLPRVAMQIDASYRLRQGATADLRMFSNSGELNRYILLTNGGGPNLGDGAVIPSTQTDQPVEIDKVLSTLDPATRAELRSVLGSLDSSSRGLAGAFRSALHHSAGAFAAVASDLGQVTQDGAALRTLVSQSKVVLGALATNRTALARTVEQLSGLSATTGKREAELASTVTRLPAGLRSVRGALGTLRAALPQLDTFVKVAQPATEQLVPTLEQLEPTLMVARPVLLQARDLLQRSPPQLRALRPLLGAAGPFLDNLTAVLGTSQVMLDLVRVYTPELAGALANWSSMAGTYDAAGHVLRILATAAPPPNIARPLDSIAPGFLPSPYTRAPGSLAGTPWDDFQKSFLSGGEH
jgi:phospholipid/cholesterol/gamma-HCH transport system substrate-binding protein